jgi:hypothetical protein
MHSELKKDVEAILAQIDAAAKAATEENPLRHAIGVKVRGKLITTLAILKIDEEEAKLEAKAETKAAKSKAPAQP